MQCHKYASFAWSIRWQIACVCTGTLTTNNLYKPDFSKHKWQSVYSVSQSFPCQMPVLTTSNILPYMCMHDAHATTNYQVNPVLLSTNGRWTLYSNNNHHFFMPNMYTYILQTAYQLPTICNSFEQKWQATCAHTHTSMTHLQPD